MMEMLNAGLLEVIVVDDWKAHDVGAGAAEDQGATRTVAVRAGGQIGWAIRKDSPKLAAELDDFYANFVKKQGAGRRTGMQQYHKRIKQLKDPTGTARSGSASRRRSRCSRSTARSTASIR